MCIIFTSIGFIIVTYSTAYTWVLHNKNGFISHTIIIFDNGIFFTALETTEIITLQIIVLY
jgi:hypothetical protein